MKARRVNTYQHLIIVDDRRIDVPEFQDIIRCPVLVLDDCLDGILPSRSALFLHIPAWNRTRFDSTDSFLPAERTVVWVQTSLSSCWSRTNNSSQSRYRESKTVGSDYEDKVNNDSQLHYFLSSLKDLGTVAAITEA